MGWFDDSSSQANSYNQYNNIQDGQHQASLTHEILGSAVAYEASKAYEDHCAANGQPDSHAKAKEIFSGIAGGIIDREVETKGLDFIDKEKARYQAQQHFNNNVTQDNYNSYGTGSTNTYNNSDSYGSGNRSGNDDSYNNNSYGSSNRRTNDSYGSSDRPTNDSYGSGNRYNNDSYGSSQNNYNNTDSYGSSNNNYNNDSYSSSNRNDSYGSGNRNDSYGSGNRNDNYN